jgi:monoamine oxidase
MRHQVHKKLNACTSRAMSICTSPHQPVESQQPLHDVVIVGDGLSGVLLAHEIHQDYPHLSWVLLEARSVLGGRLQNDDMGQQIDLGGAWIWPPSQPYMKQLVKKLSLPTFLQPDDPTSTRVVGGAVQIVNTLSKNLPQDHIHLESPVTGCSLVVSSASNNNSPRRKHPKDDDDDDDDKRSQVVSWIRLDTANDKTFLARHVVMAAPPKVISNHVLFDPPLSRDKQSAMNTCPTWMAGVTKIALIYPKAFWIGNDTMTTNMGLPRSNNGPAFQMYDASTADGSVAALTFFALLPPQHSLAIATDDKTLAEQIVHQVATVWKYHHHGQGDNNNNNLMMMQQLQSYSQIHVQRWPQEQYISEDDKPTTIHPHPYPVAALAQPEWEGRLLFAGSETDQQSPGVMEGAVGSVYRVLSQLSFQSNTSQLDSARDTK